MKTNTSLRSFFKLFLFFIYVNLYSQEQAIQASADGYQYPEVKSNHPRLEINQDVIDRIAGYITNINSAPDRFKYLYENTKYDALEYLFNGFYNDVYLNKGDIRNWKWDFNEMGNEETPSYHLGELKLILFYYKIKDKKKVKTKDDILLLQLLKARVNFIAEKYISYLDNLNTMGTFDFTENCHDRWGVKNKLIGISAFGAFLYDWGFNVLNDNLRKEIAINLYDLSYKFMATWVYRDIEYRCKKEEKEEIGVYNNNIFVFGHLLRHHMNNMKLILSLYDSNDLVNQQQNNIRFRFEFLIRDLHDEFLKIYKHQVDDDNDGYYDDDEGGQVVGGSYAHVKRKLMTEYLDLLTTATNKNYFSENDWYGSVINQLYFLVRPNGASIHLNDGLWSKLSGATNFEVYALNKHYKKNSNTEKNDFIKKIHDLVVKYESYNNGSHNSRLYEMLYRDFENNTIEPKPTQLDWFSDKSGIVVSKTSNNEDATQVVFYNSPLNQQGHQHMNNNSFTIYKKDPLIMNSGVYSYEDENKHYQNYYIRTVSHNAMTFYDESEKFEYGFKYVEDENGDVSKVPIPISNDGGQLVRYPQNLINYSDIEDESTKQSPWLNQVSKKVDKDERAGIDYDYDFNYSVADATTSYSSEKIKSYVRKLLFLKPNKVFVLDHVKLNKELEPKYIKFNLHFQNRPEILSYGNSKDSIIYDNNPASEDGVEVYYGKKYVVKNNKGVKATIKTLMPYKSKATIVGGNGYEAYVNGRNYPHTNVSTEIEDVSDWRLEVSPQKIYKGSTNFDFVHTIDIDEDPNKTRDYNETLLLHNVKYPNTIGILSENTIVAFSSKGTGNNSEHKLDIKFIADQIEASEEGKQYRLMCFDLEPNTNYCLKFKESSFGRGVTTDSNGVLLSYIWVPSGAFKSLYVLKKEGNDNSCGSNLLSDVNDDVLDDNFIIYPNPVNNDKVLNVEINNREETLLSITNVNGQLLKTEILHGKKNYSLKLNGFTAGVYFVKIIQGSTTKVKKVIVK